MKSILFNVLVESGKLYLDNFFVNGLMIHGNEVFFSYLLMLGLKKDNNDLEFI